MKTGIPCSKFRSRERVLYDFKACRICWQTSNALTIRPDIRCDHNPFLHPFFQDDMENKKGFS